MQPVAQNNAKVMDEKYQQPSITTRGRITGNVGEHAA